MQLKNQLFITYCVRHWDRQQRYGDEKDTIPAPHGVHWHVIILFQQGQKAFYSLLHSLDLNPWNLQLLVPAWSCLLPLESPSKYKKIEVHQLSWALLSHFIHPQTSPTGLLFPKHTSCSPMFSLLFQEDFHFHPHLYTPLTTYLKQHPPGLSPVTAFIFLTAFNDDLKLHYFTE